MRIGVICPSEIAFRRFMPALRDSDDFEFVGLGVCNAEERFGKNLPEESVVENVLNAEYEKAKMFTETYGGKIFESYQSIIESDEIEAIYIPLPPALHFKWAKEAMKQGKHVLVEKPSTVTAEDTKELVALAEEKGLALHENYMFIYHKQLDEIEQIVDSGEIGSVRLYRISFGFPMRAKGDFRYNKALGGGALFDAGGYTLKYADRLLGENASNEYAKLNYVEDLDVDLYGSGVLSNDKGDIVLVSFGMDNEYKCELEVWGSKGILSTGRVLTAPAGFVPQVTLRKGNKDEVRELSADDTFRKSITQFANCIKDEEIRKKNYRKIERQAQLVEDFKKKAQESVGEK